MRYQFTRYGEIINTRKFIRFIREQLLTAINRIYERLITVSFTSNFSHLAFNLLIARALAMHRTERDRLVENSTESQRESTRDPV